MFDEPKIGMLAPFSANLHEGGMAGQKINATSSHGKIVKEEKPLFKARRRSKKIYWVIQNSIPLHFKRETSHHTTFSVFDL